VGEAERGGRGGKSRGEGQVVGVRRGGGLYECGGRAFLNYIR